MRALYLNKFRLAPNLGLAILTAIFSLAGSSPAAANSNAFHTCAVTTSGNVKCWGWNGSTQLGDGTATDSATPVDVVGLSGGTTRQVSTGSNATCVVTTSGGVKCWGFGGGGNGPSSSVPTDVPGLTSGVVQVSANYYYACALTTGGGVKCWGYNSNGQLGDGTNVETGATPVDVVGLSSGIAQISTGIAHACALTTSGGVKCWGYNGNGEVGNGTFSTTSTPVDVSGLSSGVVLLPEISLAQSVPFESLRARVEIEHSRRPTLHGADSFEVQGRGVLGAASNGITPNTEDVTLSLGSFSLTIPAGSFVKKQDRDDDYGKMDCDDRTTTYRFKGVIAGVSVRAEIEQGPNGTFRFAFEGKRASLGTVLNPVTVGLAIGDDAGQAIVKARIDK